MKSKDDESYRKEDQTRDSALVKELKHRINVLEMDLAKAKIELEIAKSRNTK